MMRLVPQAHNGRAFLRISNESDHASTVTGLIRLSLGNVASAPLLETKLFLIPTQSVLLDVTERLTASLPQHGEHIFELLVNVDPEKQSSSPSRYRLRMENGQIAAFDALEM